MTTTEAVPITANLHALDFTPTCDTGRMPNSTREPCENPAAFYVVARCCGLSGFKCDPHLTAAPLALAVSDHQCNACRHVHPAGSTLADAFSRIQRI